MALLPQTATSTDPLTATDETDHVNAPGLQAFVIGLFFVMGGLTSLNDVVIPKLKDLFTLNYMQAMLVQTAFFAAYALIGIPGAALVRRVGYMRGAVFGLLTMMAGCLLFIPASSSAIFGLFLFALFVLAAGVTVVQVVANPLVSMLGPPDTAPSRLTFAQAFNSLGTVVFPIAGSALILGSLANVNADQLTGAALDAYRMAETQTVVRTYIGLAITLAIVAGVVWMNRNRLRGEKHEAGSLLHSLDLLRLPRFRFGTLCIFLYVGAEVAIGSLIVNYLELQSTMGLAQKAAGDHIPLYWGGALVGRFIGAAVMRSVDPGKVLAANAAGAIALIALSANTGGMLAGYSLLAVGLMNSIMFPTIFSLASEGLGKRAAEGSGLICVAIVGGAIIPPVTGHLADVGGSLQIALTLPALCYGVIAAFGVFARRRG